MLGGHMDTQIRLAAFQWLEKQVTLHGYYLPRNLLTQGFDFQGYRIAMLGPQGIWKPKVMDYPISIMTDPDSHYDDTWIGDDLILYNYQGENPNSWDNLALVKIMEKRLPLIYFYKAEVGKYLAEWPIYITNANPFELKFTISMEDQNIIQNQNELEYGNMKIADAEAEYRRRYSTKKAIKRLHQGKFRVRVLSAYQEQCAFCCLRHLQLLDAAHIIPDTEEGGEPVVPNGLSLCKIHHAAFDSNIVGLSPDYKIIVREDILEEIDGPMLRYGIQEMHGQEILLPSKRNNWPDQNKLEIRFKRFLKAG